MGWLRVVVAGSAVTLVALVAGVGGVAPAFGLAGFGSKGEGAGQFSEPLGVAVNQESGDVYVVDRGGARAERWTAAGTFVSAWGWGVRDGLTHAFQICTVQCVAGLEGSGAGQFGVVPAGLAIDNSLGLSRGDVYVADPRNFRIEKFSASGEFLLMLGSEVNETKDNTLGATEAERNVCPVEAGDVCKAGVAGGGAGAFTGLGANPIAVDALGAVYIGDSERVQKFNESGALEGAESLPVGSGFVNALAVDSAGDIYAETESSEVNGVQKFEGCVGSCVGKELGTPRDSAGAIGRSIAVGPADELFVYDVEAKHVFEYAPSGVQQLSLGEEGSSSGIALGDEAKALYLPHEGEVRVRELPPAGPVVLAESADEALPTSAAVHALVNPEGPKATTYHFEYGPTTAYGASSAEEPLAGEPFEDHAISAALSGLSPRTVYHYRVVVSNGSQTTLGPDQTFTTLPPVGIEGESVTQVTATSVRLIADLNAHGLSTEYHFEYGPSSSYGTAVPVPDGDAGQGTSGAAFGIVIEGLAPASTYHYRVVAHNALGTVQGEDHVFATETGEVGGLLDGRAWELVSPPDKHGVSLEAMASEGSLIQAAEDGSGLTYIAKAPVDSNPPSNRSIANTQLLAKRKEPGVWATQDISTPHEAIVGLALGDLSEYKQFSGDLSRGFVQPFGTTLLSNLATERSPYLRDTVSGQYTPLLTSTNVPEGTKFGGEEFQPGVFINGVEWLLATPDAKYAILRSPLALTPNLVTGGKPSLYEWSEGKLQLVSILPNGEPTVAQEAAQVGLGWQSVRVRNTISTDGNRVIFEANPTSEGRHLYVRDIARGETLAVDLPMPGAHGQASDSAFQTASADGTRVFFTTGARLTIGAGAHSGAPDLYECEITLVAGHLSCALKDLTVPLHPGEAAEVLNDVIGSDSTGRLVYFAANGALAPGAVHGECENGNPVDQVAAVSCNLYVVDTQTGVVRLVAVVSNRDARDWAAPLGRSLGSLSAGVSENGQWFTFMSQRSLTGFDNRDAVSGERDVEVYLYDQVSDSLRCVSCALSGGRPRGVFEKDEFPGLLPDRSVVWGGQWLAGLIPTWTRIELGRALYQSRFLSDSGRLFFDTPVGLVPGDGNRRMDVYEFEPFGGGCKLPSGCIGLVSSGTSGEESAFLDASKGGSDVFFMTAGRLTSADTDGSFDVYNAHECSSAVPCASGVVSVPPACSTVDSCRAAPPAQPAAFGPPPSSTFSGIGNTKPTVVKPPTRAQKLAKALAACKRKPRAKRASCRARARRLYGSAPHSRKQNPGKRGRGR